MNENVFSRQSLAEHILRAMSLAQREGRRVDLEGLTAELGARRGDVRGTLSALHRQGLVDVTKMSLTLAGFALGARFASRPASPLRTPAARLHVIKAA
jgi:Mn-dependent DtxR family transcriptional regulator